MKLPTYEDVLRAAHHLNGVAHTTPVLQSSTLNERVQANVFFKCENFQRVGAFKFRGAYNALSHLSVAELERGVVTFSSGNHAQAVALAAKLKKALATVIMPNTAPKAKKTATLGYGATVIEYDRLTQDREGMAQHLVQTKGMTLVPPFAHPHVIAGQATAAKELIEEVGELDVLLVPLGGGGLLSGALLAAQALSPNCKVYGVEPVAGNDAQQSLAAGKIITIAQPQSIADGAITPALAPLTFEIIQRYAAGILTVTDAQLVTALQFFAERMKMVVEPTGCLGAAAAMQQNLSLKGLKVGVIVSGGNVDISYYGQLLATR